MKTFVERRKCDSDYLRRLIVANEAIVKAKNTVKTIPTCSSGISGVASGEAVGFFVGGLVVAAVGAVVGTCVGATVDD